MPGVVVTTKAASGSGTALSENSGQFFVAGMAERGVTDKAVLIRGIADFESEFGGRTTYSYLHDTVRMFFEEGGEQAYVSRIVGPSASAATTVVSDQASSPVPTITIGAKSDGTWGNSINVDIEVGSTSGTVKISVSVPGQEAEIFDNLATPAGIVTALSRSAYVSVTDMGSGTAAPNNLPEIGDYQLTGGSDDRENATPVEYKSALDNFNIGFGSGAVAIPGVGSSVHAVLIEHAKANRRIALLSADSDATIAELQSEASGLNTEFAGLFAPWVNVSDGYGGARPVSPEGYVAAVRARAHKEIGPERTPAGQIAISRSLVSLAVNYTSEEGNLLDYAKVSVIRNINNTTRLYGWRSLSNNLENWKYLNGADLMNYLVTVSEQELEQYVFATVDSKGQMLSAMYGTLVGVIEPIAARGGLYPFYDDAGEEVDPGYVVKTGKEINSIANLRNNEVRALLGFRLAPVGAMISLTIVKTSLTAGF